MAERIAQTVASEPATASKKERAFLGSQGRIPIRTRIAAGIFMIPGFAGIIACGGSGDSAQVTFQTPTSTAAAEAPATTADGGVKVKVGDTAAATIVSGGNDGGSKGGNVTVVPTEAPKTPTKAPEPTATPTTEVKPATILDKPVTAVTMDQLRSEASTAYASKPQAFKDSDGSIYSKQNLDRGLAYCETGNPSIPEVRIEQNRLGECAGIIRLMVALYRLNGDPVLMQIAMDTRSYFVGQYPQMKAQLDEYLRQARIQ